MGRRRGGRAYSGHGWGGHHGMGGSDMMRAGRALAQGDLRLIALALIAEQPRHGYEIIKVLEAKTSGWYSPSPGIVYPTLTHLEEAGYITAHAQRAKKKKLYTITAEGRAYLNDCRSFVYAVLDRLAAIGERVSRMRRRFESNDDERGLRASPMVDAAIENLREIAARRIEGDVEAEAKLVQVLLAAAAQLKKV